MSNEISQPSASLLVSIRCLAFNQAKFIRQCLEGFVIQQTNFRFEAIVHDDASTDGTADIIREYANKYPKIIKPIFEKENQYSKHDGSIRQVMNKACHGKYIAYCEGDDCWTDPLKLQKQVDILESNPNVTMVFTGFRTIDENGADCYRYDFEYNMHKSKSGYVFPMLLYRNVVMTVSSIFRREVFFSSFKLGGPNGLDYVMFLSAAAMGNAVYLPEKTCCYRKVGGSVTNSNNTKIQKMVIEVVNYFTHIYIRNGINMSIYNHLKLRIIIVAKGIDLWLKGQDRGYLHRVLKAEPLFWIFLIPGSIQECYYLLSYYIPKLLPINNK